MRLNSFTIGAFTAYGNQHVSNGGANIIAFEGLQSAARRVSKFDLSGQHGAFVTSSFYGGRTLAVSVQIFGSSVANFASRVNDFLAELDLDAAPATLSFTTAEGDTYFVTGYAQQVNDGPKFGERRYGTYVFEFFCEDYRIFDDTLNSEQIFLADSSGGFTIPTIIPISFGSASGGYAVLTNNGNTNASPTITFNGPLTADITVYNATTDKRFTYRADIANGYSVIVDTKNKTVVDQDGANRMLYVSTTYRDFIELVPGDNEIYFSHGGAYNTTGNVVFEWYDAYLGV